MDEKNCGSREVDKLAGGLADFPHEVLVLELGHSSAFDAVSSGKFPHGLLDSVKTAPAPIMLCATSTIELTTWIVTFFSLLALPIKSEAPQGQGPCLIPCSPPSPRVVSGRSCLKPGWLTCDEHPESKREEGRGISHQRWKTHGFLFSGPELYSDGEEGDMCYPPEAPSPTLEDEVYLTINSTMQDQLPCGECLEADSGTIPLPQFCSWGTFSESLPPEESCDSEGEWEDLEEAENTDDGTLRWVSLCLGRMRLHWVLLAGLIVSTLAE